MSGTSNAMYISGKGLGLTKLVWKKDLKIVFHDMPDNIKNLSS